MSEDLKGVRTECAVLFREIVVKLNLIKNNDLVHIQDDIRDIRGWIRATALVGLSAVVGILVKVVLSL